MFVRRCRLSSKSPSRSRLRRKRNGPRRGGRPAGERSHLSHRRGPQPVRQTSAGKRFLGAEFAGHTVISGNRRRFQRPLPWLGDHAENSFSLDGQPITDQQSKVFSNQIPLDAVQSMAVIAGAPPAEYGGKTSLVIDVTTRSGNGRHHTARRHHRQLRHVWHLERGLRLLLRRQELGELHRRQRARQRPLSRSARVRGYARRRAMRRMFSTAWTISSPKRTLFT